MINETQRPKLAIRVTVQPKQLHLPCSATIYNCYKNDISFLPKTGTLTQLYNCIYLRSGQ